MKMRQIAAMLIPFLAAAMQAGKNSNEPQMRLQLGSYGNAQSGYHYSKNKCNRKKKSNRITMKKRLQIKHKRKAA